MNIDNLFNYRYATFYDIGTIALNDGSEKYIKTLGNSTEAIILVFRAHGNYKAWIKSLGINDNINTYKAFYNLVLACDWKTEIDPNIATAKNILNTHIDSSVYYTKMARI